MGLGQVGGGVKQSGDERRENYERNFTRVRLNQNTLSIMMVMVHAEAVSTKQ